MRDDRSVRALTRAEIANLVEGDRVTLQFWAIEGSRMVVRDLIEAGISHRGAGRVEATPLKNGAFRSHIRIFSVRSGADVTTHEGTRNRDQWWELAVHCNDSLALVRAFDAEAMKHTEEMKQLEISRILAIASRDKLDKLRYGDLVVARKALEGHSTDSEVVE
jgi:hypothetical protein